MKRNLFTTILLFICVAATASTAVGFRGPYNSAAYVGQPASNSNLLIENGLYVDGNRTDSYTPDGGLSKPYKTVLEALAVVNADVGKSWTMYVAPGTYSDNLTITGARHLKIQAAGGVVLSGTILINSGVGSYDRIEFVGTEGGRAEKGPALTISGKITATRTNDSLIYVGFHGCLISGEFEATTSGTWVLQYSNCRVNGAITGTFNATDPDETILIEAHGFNEFVGAITGKTSFYNCNGADIYSAITTTPWYENRFTHCTFGGAVSIIPQVGASSVVTYLDSITYKSLKARTPTLTGVTLSHTDGGIMTGATTEILVGGGDGTNPVWTTATGTGSPVRAGSPTVTRLVNTTATLSAAGPTDNLDVSGVNTVLVDTSSNNVTLGGMTGGVSGQQLRIVIVNATNNTTLENAEATGNQDIYLESAGDETKTAVYGGWLLECNGTHWYQVAGSLNSGGGAPTDATYITQTANGSLSAEQALGTLATGILKNTTTTGILSIAADGTDYLAPTRIDDAKGNGDTGYVWSADKVYDLLQLKQAADTELGQLAALTFADDQIILGTGAGTVGMASCTAFAQSILDDANEAAFKATVNLEIGTDVQAYNAYLADIAGITANQGDIVYFNGTDWVDLAPGDSGKYLKTQGAAANPMWDTPAGAGNVSKVGTPVNNQVGVWTGDGTIEGAASLTYDGANLQLTGDIGSTGTRITKGWFTDLAVTNSPQFTGIELSHATENTLTGSGGNAYIEGTLLVKNPMTTAGDIIYGGVSGAPTRLGAVNNSILGWNGSGTLGAYTNISIDNTAAQFYDSAAPTKLVKIDPSNQTAGNTGVIQAPNNGTATLTAGTQVAEATATGGIVLGDASPDANGEIGYASNAYSIFANSEDLTLTASANTWTASSATGVTEINLSAMNLVTTGTIDAGLPTVSSTDATITVAGKSRVYFNGDDDVIAFNLPADPSNCAFCFGNTEYGRAITVNPDDADYIVLDGTKAAAGEAIVSSGDAKDWVCLVGISSGLWRVTGNIGTWAEETP